MFDIDDTTLLRGAAKGDLSSYNVLFRRHYPAVVAYALTLAEGHSRAEDAAHEAMVLLWRKRARVRVVDESILPWLLVTTKNCLRNIARSDAREARRQREAAPEHPMVDVEDVVLRRQADELLAACLDELSPLDREVFVSCALEGRSYKEVAAEKSLTERAVGNRLSRTKERLRKRVRALREEQ